MTGHRETSGGVKGARSARPPSVTRHAPRTGKGGTHDWSRDRSLEIPTQTSAGGWGLVPGGPAGLGDTHGTAHHPHCRGRMHRLPGRYVSTDQTSQGGVAAPDSKHPGRCVNSEPGHVINPHRGEDRVSTYHPGGDVVNWLHHAACRDHDPEIWFPAGTSGPALLQIADAKTVCQRCPVNSECLNWALGTGQDVGIWGGMNEDERRALKRRNARTEVRTGGAR